MVAASLLTPAEIVAAGMDPAACAAAMLAKLDRPRAPPGGMPGLFTAITAADADAASRLE